LRLGLDFRFILDAAHADAVDGLAAEPRRCRVQTDALTVPLAVVVGAEDLADLLVVDGVQHHRLRRVAEVEDRLRLLVLADFFHGEAVDDDDSAARFEIGRLHEPTGMALRIFHVEVSKARGWVRRWSALRRGAASVLRTVTVQLPPNSSVQRRKNFLAASASA